MHSAGRITLGLIALVSAASWFGAVAFGTSAIHQILAGVYALIFTVAIAALGLNAALSGVAERLPKPRQAPPSS
jgi:hypothetical protein